LKVLMKMDAAAERRVEMAEDVMMASKAKQILAMRTVDERTSRRCAAYADFLVRLARAEGHETTTGASIAPDATSLLQTLATRGATLIHPLAGDEWEVKYRPTYEACLDTFEAAGKDGVWPKKIQRNHVDAFRSSDGAIFQFPLEFGGGSIDIFITDWSPCPAACALAIHRAHQHAVAPPDSTPSAADYFTGKFVRHPLTGDLLPVWVASFVRPDFGTGAVLVNPAHDRADLAFGRKLGLPIKFALVNESYDGHPANWHVPPVLKTGKAIRTGLCDGASAAEAKDIYMKLLVSLDLAKPHKDINPGLWTIGKLVPSADGAIRISRANFSLVFSGEDDAALQRYAYIPNDTFLAPLTQRTDTPITIVCQAGDANSLLAFRLLAREFMATRPTFDKVEVVQAVGGKEQAEQGDDYYLATILTAKMSETAAPKAQDVEKVSRFRAVHEELRSRGSFGSMAGESDQAVQAAARNVKKTLYRDGLAQGFAELYRLQKQLRDHASRNELPEKSCPAYFALAQVFTGLPAITETGIRDAWSEL
jgi:leucyl-tRNA synthetase